MERRAQISRHMDEGVPNSYHGIESERRVASCVIGPGIDISMESSVAGRALRSGLLVTEESMEIDCNPLLKELNRYRIENDQSEKLIL